jgi:hypothetical protein
MSPLEEADFEGRLATPQVKRYAQPVDRESAREMLAARLAAEEDETAAAEDKPAGKSRRREPPSALARMINAPLTRTVVGIVTRGLVGAIIGPPRRRATRRRRS